VERGEVWWAKMAQPYGTRPVLLLSRSHVYRVRNSVSVAVITTHARRIPVEVPLGREDGMPRPCVVNGDEVHTIPMIWIDNQITILTAERMKAVVDAVRYALDMECE
jgi:mRNA-degrading endonuclease toxin of MazEF toxin-antitoxin module